ncbi:jg4730 [Pararge aegeria aegeria]|uniref:Jg4730 protein n=1 Tax=Pararge aegeria aegeria TaxID=348720 RepID=A0A8S4RA08_9NEOP|nr:jg4730 [Pararge aegeria aegeria]
MPTLIVERLLAKLHWIVTDEPSSTAIYQIQGIKLILPLEEAFSPVIIIVSACGRLLLNISGISQLAPPHPVLILPRPPAPRHSLCSGIKRTPEPGSSIRS